MSAALLALALLLTSGGGWLALAERRRLDRRARFLLHFPPDLGYDAVRSFMRSLSGWSSRSVVRPSFVFTLSSEAGRLIHTVSIPQASADAVLAQLGSCAPGLTWEPLDSLPTRLDKAIAIGLSSRERPLRTDEPVALTTSLLAALRTSAKTDQVAIQYVVTPSGEQPVARRTGSPGSMQGSRRRQLWRALATPPLTATDPVALARHKSSEPLFAVAIRIAASAPSVQHQRQLLRTAQAGLQILRNPGVSFVRRSSLVNVAAQMATERTPWMPAAQMNAAELALLVGWPLAGSRAPGAAVSSSRYWQASDAVPKSGRILGHALVGGRTVAAPIADATKNLLVTGATGSGKSVLLASLIAQDIAATPHRAVVVIEPKDLIRDVLGQIPARRLDDVIVLDPADPASTIGFNPLATSQGADREVLIDGVFSVIHALYASSWGPRLADLLYASLTLLSHTPGYTLAELPYVLTSLQLRRQLQANLGAQAWATKPVWSWYDNLPAGEAATVAGPLLNKARTWAARPRMRQLVGVAAPRWSFDEVLAHGKILLVCLSSGTLGRETANLTGALLVDGLWRAITARGSMPPNKRRLAMVYLDEWASYTRLPIDLGEALAMTRGYNAAFTLATQSPSLLPTELRNAAFGQARSKVSFVVGHHDAPALAHEFGDEISPNDLTHLGRFEALAKLIVDNTTAAPFSLRTLAPPPPISDEHVVRAHSAARYGFARDEVEQAIRERIQPPPPDGSIGRRRS